MNAIKGKTRFVLVFPALGIVFKFPIIRIWEALKRIWGYRNIKYRKALAVICCTWKPESSYVVPGLILQGIIANRRERALWKRTRNPFLQPTIFSFFGLLNIQLYGKVHKSPYLDLWDQIRRITREEAYLDPYQFSEPSNYCLADGKLRILDYGGKGSPWVVLKYGKKIMEEFDLKYHYTEASADGAQSSQGSPCK